eukprot:CAMPEP_0184970026 /NCGR_PEP_ID=MMETSP1098-20130426/2604_1 /TAXON_ID=89044 /ORGANISM="Spumella elongata, Strain CCAP 955/1" /LENGTH=751 /DNA_ID=CAMNT_0027491883 /DNA_START=92 /DNA_END=2347 /DNA_ORIENTATION=+
MASMKSMIMGVIDVGSSMGESLNGTKDTKLSVASSFYSSYVLQRMVASKTVEFGLVTYGSDMTNNFLNTNQGGYESVEEVVPMEKPDITSIQYIANIKPGSGRGDLIDGIVVGQDILNRTNVKKAFNKILLLITDGETEVEGVEDLETIVGNMKSIVNFSLYIAMVGKVTPTSSVIKRENAKLLQSLAESIEGRFAEMEDPRDGFYLLAGGAGLGTKPQLLKTTLQLAPQVRIPCQYWSKISKGKVPTLKKVALPAGATATSAALDELEAGTVKRDTTYRNPEDPDVELGPEEKVKGYKYGPQYVPVTAVEEDIFKLKSPASVTVIGAIPIDRIPRYHFLESPLFLQGSTDLDSAQVAVTALCRALREANKILLARFVKRENADPFLAALIPSDLEGQEHSLLVHRLPCAEDVRDYLFPSLLAFDNPTAVAQNPTLQQQQAAVSAFVDSVTLAAPLRAEICPVNPVLFNFYNSVRDKITGVCSTDINVSTGLKDTLVSPFANSAAATAALNTVYQKFALEKLESKKKRKTYWSEIEVKTGGEAAAGSMAGGDIVEAARKLARSTSEAASSIGEGDTDVESVLGSSLEDQPDFSAGSVAPVEDFQAVVAFAVDPILRVSEEKRQGLVKSAMQTLMDIVERHITLGASPAYYKRAVSCLTALRTAAVEQHQAHHFNAFLRDKIKLPHQFGRHSALWRLVVDDKLTLVSSAEDPDSSASPQDADAFLHAVAEQPVSAPVVAAADEEDDLFGSMA